MTSSLKNISTLLSGLFFKTILGERGGTGEKGHTGVHGDPGMPGKDGEPGLPGQPGDLPDRLNRIIKYVIHEPIISVYSACLI